MLETREHTAQRIETVNRPVVSAIILAAGMSKRMGSLKQLMKVGNCTLLEHTIRTVADSSVSEIILVLGYQSEKILKAITLNSGAQRTRVVVNDVFAQGMSTSIKAGLQSLAPDSEAALIVLADQPFLNPSIINQLTDEYRREKAPIILPVYKGFRGNPVLVDRSLFGEMMQISGDIGCRSLFGLHPKKIHTVNLADASILVDIDTADDFKRFSSIKESSLDETSLQIQLDDRSVTQDASKERRASEHVARLVVIGGDTVATSLAKLGKVLKFHVTVIDPFLSEDDMEVDDTIQELDLRKADVSLESYIVIASRGKYDEDALAQALETKARYIGVLGSKKRGAEMIQHLRSGGVSDEELKRVRSPAGLEIYASTPEEIALSILAEIVNIRRQHEQETRELG